MAYLFPWQVSGPFPPTVTLAQFQAFITGVMGIGPNYLPATSPYPQWALDQATNTVNPALAVSPSQMDGSLSPYQLAVLNLAGHLLLEYAQDVSWPIVSASWAAGYATLALAPAAPVLTPGSGGALPTGTVYCRTAYVYASGAVGAPSAEMSAVITGPDGSLAVGSPSAAPGAVGWSVFAAPFSGAEILQNATPLTIGSPYEITALAVGTAAPPTLAVMPGDKVAVTGVSPNPYNAGAWQPIVVYAATPAAGTLAYPIAVNPGPATVLSGASVSETLFYSLRRSFGLAVFAPGVVGTASDQGTGVGLLNQDFMRQLQFSDLQLIKTVYGRTYLAIAQKWGPTIWGLS